MKTRRKSVGNSRRARNVAASRRPLVLAANAFEQLEGRRLMTLLGVVPGFPQIDTTGSGAVAYTYNSTTSVGSFDLSALPANYYPTSLASSNPIRGVRAFEIHFKTDGSGNPTGGVVGADFVVNGFVDLNNNFVADPGEPSGNLLSGEILQFGSQNLTTTVDVLDFRFLPTGGALLPQYGTDDIGVSMTIENSTFNGSFNTGFTANRVKATVGPITGTSVSGVKTEDVTGNGFSGDDVAMGGVTINLFKDNDNDGFLTVNDGAAVKSTVTAANGAYSFTGLVAGRYFVQEVVPTGSVQTGGPGYYTANTVYGQNTPGLDFANFRKISISGTKTEDKTGNGFSGDDSRLGGVTINLYRDSGNGGGLDGADPLVTFVSTDSNGDYSFSDLGPGTYYVQEVLLAGWSQTGGPAYYTVTATSNVPSTGNNFANFKNITIGGNKYNDITGNGITGDDQPLADITIELVDASNTVVATTTTAADGTYSFLNVGPGTYTVREVAPAGWTQTGGPATYTITATSGTNSSGNDFSNFKRITIRGIKYTDVTGNSFSGDDTVLGGVTVNLYLDSDHSTVIATTTTAADGSFKFENLGPGTYFVQEAVPAGYVQTGGNSGYVVVASSGGDSSGNDFANFKKITISGNKYNDVTGNSFSADDQPLGGVTVNLYDGGGSLIGTTVTLADGSYKFENLGPGTYFVQEVVPAGSVQTGGTAGYTVVATSGTDSSGNDFANFKKITIRGTKYNDVTGNSFSADDQPQAGVTINLYDGGGNLVASTVTLADGTYKFENLGPGSYFVQEVVPAGSIQTGGTAGYTVAASSGTDSNGNNFANFKKIKIEGIKYRDLTGNSFSGDDTPLAGITIRLYLSPNLTTPVASAVTGADGSYKFENLGPGTYYVQEVVPAGYNQTGGNAGYTVAATSGTNATGKNFANYKLAPAIQIKKYVNPETNAGGGEGLTPGFWKQSQHFYAWTGYSPSDNYNTVFGLTASQEDPSLTLLGALERGGGENEALGRHAVAAILNAANTNVSYLYTSSQIKAMVQQAYATSTFEHNKNLLAYQNELGADLSTPAPTTGPALPGYGYDAETWGSGPTVAAGTQLTFTFVVTNPGQTPLVNVVVTDDNATPGNTADDFNPTPVLSGGFNVGDTNHDSILDLNETWIYKWVTAAKPGTWINTATVTGKNVFNTTETVTDDDKAYYTTNDLPAAASLGDRVWFDTDHDGIQDSNETGVPSVLVTLYNSIGAPLGFTTTDSNGFYSFTDLAPGTYSVGFTLPAGYYFSPKDQGSNDAADSDANTTTGLTAQVTLAAGQHNPTLDAGIYTLSSTIQIKKYVNPLEGPTVGGEGLTPGFWKQSQHFYAWTGYTQGQNYNSVFGLTSSQEDSTLTLLGALGRGGGEENALGRHAVAALLNAANANVSYAYTTSQIITMVKNAYLTGNFETTKNLLAVENEKGADLTTGSTTNSVAEVGYGYDADTVATAPTMYIGSQVMFTLVVTNPGQTELTQVVVRDDNATPANAADDFNPTPKLDDDGYNIGDDDNVGSPGTELEFAL